MNTDIDTAPPRDARQGRLYVRAWDTRLMMICLRRGWRIAFTSRDYFGPDEHALVMEREADT